ncbi:chemotaxis protein CheW [Vibrio methylphosphonaticus]|uniref:chemotaxis protein CheW n=1 Tax=Vibrio methylphosphonaticus TaxID=2946866 RepID=UPI00202A4940|nr:chemotaxis protein CheW [Vibrio methylphosphonaticus]MCL9774516.1 chemotaxis protein CheW [Vibrio methylphosphonaticus]
MAMDEAPLSSEQALDDYFNSLLGIGDCSEDESEDHSSSEAASIDVAPSDFTPSDVAPSEIVFDETTNADHTAVLDARTDSIDGDVGQRSVEYQAASVETVQYDGGNEACVETATFETSAWQAQPSVHPESSAQYGRSVDYDEPPNLQQLEKLFDGMRLQTEADTPEMLQPLLQPEPAQPELMQSELMQSVEEQSGEPEIQHWALPETEYVEESTSDADAVSSDPDIEHRVSEPEQTITLDNAGGTDQVNSGGGEATIWQSTERSENFQVLYFAVNGMTFAVPLDELGGIHKMGELSHLIGRPAWYLGLQSSRDNKLDVVDTAKWVMPDVLADDDYKSEYEYIVMLGESNWGLASTELKGTEQLRPEAVRWREQSGKRPWLAGMVKEQMCALVHVSELIGMLNAGLDVNSVQ